MAAKRYIAALTTATLGVALGAVILAGIRQPSPQGPPDASTSRGGAPGVLARPAAPEPVPHRLEIVSHPGGAGVMIDSPGEVSQAGATPFSARVMGGNLKVSVSLEGYNPLEQQVALDRDRRLELWLDPKGLLHHKLGEFKTGSNPKQVAFSPEGRELWVTLLGGRGVQVFDTQTREKLSDIGLGAHGAVEVIFSRDGATAYASQMQTASAFEIDARTHAVRRQIPTGGAWSKVMALSPDERTLYVANWSSNNVSEIDLGAGQVRRLLSTVGTPRGLYPTPDGRWLFVAGFADGQLARIDLASGRSEMLLETGGAMRHLVGDARRGLVYAGDMGTNTAHVVEVVTGQARKLAGTDRKPNTIDLSPDGRVLYVSNRGENGASYYQPGPEWGSVLAIDTATGRVLDAIVGGNQTTGLDVSPDGRLLAFSDFLDNRVQVFEIPPYRSLAEGGGGRAALHLAEIPKRRR